MDKNSVELLELIKEIANGAVCENEELVNIIADKVIEKINKSIAQMSPVNSNHN